VSSVRRRLGRAGTNPPVPESIFKTCPALTQDPYMPAPSLTARASRLSFNADDRRQILSLHERQGCDCGCGGGWDAPGARRELADVLAKVRLGIGRRPTAAMRERRAGSGTSFEKYARHWLEAKAEGAYGEIRAGTAAGYRCYVERHLLPALDDCLIEEVDRARCLRLRATLIDGARELREADAAGRGPRDERGRRRKPLGPASIRSVFRYSRRFSTRPSRTSCLRATPREASGCACGCQSPAGRSWRWTSSPRCLRRPAHRTNPRTRLRLTRGWARERCR